MSSIPKIFVIVLENEKLICRNTEGKRLVDIADHIEEKRRYTNLDGPYTLRDEQIAYIDPKKVIAVYGWPFEV